MFALGFVIGDSALAQPEMGRGLRESVSDDEPSTSSAAAFGSEARKGMYGLGLVIRPCFIL
jgi:hypothetical protein